MTRACLSQSRNLRSLAYQCPAPRAALPSSTHSLDHTPERSRLALQLPSSTPPRPSSPSRVVAQTLPSHHVQKQAFLRAPRTILSDASAHSAYCNSANEQMQLGVPARGVFDKPLLA